LCHPVPFCKKRTIQLSVSFNITINFFFFPVGALTAGLFILMAGYFKNPDAIISCMCVAGAAAGTVYAGFQVNMLDIAPRNASVVMGLVNAASNTAGFLSPMLVGFITHRKVPFSIFLFVEPDSIYQIRFKFVLGHKGAQNFTP